MAHCDGTVAPELDRTNGVPVGTQLAARLRGAITGGALPAGSRLPSLRALAAEWGVHLNTARAVYERLEDEGLVRSEHGRGTFVLPGNATGSPAAQLAADVAGRAAQAGVDPRDVAAALLAQDADADDPAERRRLHAEIAALERVVPDAGPQPAAPRGSGPRRQTLAELRATREALVARLVAAQADEGETGAEEQAPVRAATLRARPAAT